MNVCVCTYACMRMHACVYVREYMRACVHVNVRDRDGERDGKEQLAGFGRAWLPLKDLTYSSAPDSLEPFLILEMIIQLFQC